MMLVTLCRPFQLSFQVDGFRLVCKKFLVDGPLVSPGEYTLHNGMGLKGLNMLDAYTQRANE
jgi:hypothetical protein